MEESVQRRERLKAMRMQASHEAATNNDGCDHSAVNLSNPLLEPTTNPESQMQSFGQSFNYYTDPMAAYSGNKQRSKVSPQISQTYSSTHQRPLANETLPPPSFQPRINQSPSPQMQQPQGQYVNPSYFYTSNAPQGGNIPSPSHDFQGTSWNKDSPHVGGYHGPGSGCYPSPQPYFNRGSGQGGYPSPHFTNSPGHGSGQGYPSPGPRPHFMNSPNHGPGQVGYHSSAGPNQGRGQWHRNSLSSGPSSGRGRGQGSGSGQRGGQGRGGARDHVSAEDRPDFFFNKSMMEDPWKFLEPVVWRSQKKQWFPHSVDAKKPIVSESLRQQQQSSSQPSLAEMLAASFNEAATDEPIKE